MKTVQLNDLGSTVLKRLDEIEATFKSKAVPLADMELYEINVGYASGMAYNATYTSKKVRDADYGILVEMLGSSFD